MGRSAGGGGRGRGGGGGGFTEERVAKAGGRSKWTGNTATPAYSRFSRDSAEFVPVVTERRDGTYHVSIADRSNPNRDSFDVGTFSTRNAAFSAARDTIGKPPSDFWRTGTRK